MSNPNKTYGEKIKEEAAEIIKMFRYFEENPIPGVSSEIAFHDARMQIFVLQEAIAEAKLELGLISNKYQEL